MNQAAPATPERIWAQDPPEGCHVGGAAVQVSDEEVWISIDHIRCDSYRCPLADYLTEERGPEGVNHRDIVKTLLTAEEVLAVAEDVRSRLSKRPVQSPVAAREPKAPSAEMPGQMKQRKAPRWLAPLTIAFAIALGLVALVLLALQEWNRGNRQDAVVAGLIGVVVIGWGLRRWMTGRR